MLYLKPLENKQIQTKFGNVMLSRQTESSEIVIKIIQLWLHKLQSKVILERIGYYMKRIVRIGHYELQPKLNVSKNVLFKGIL